MCQSDILNPHANSYIISLALKTQKMLLPIEHSEKGCKGAGEGNTLPEGLAMPSNLKPLASGSHSRESDFILN